MLRLGTPADDERWDAYVHASPRAHPYHLSAWRRIIEKSFRHRSFCLLSEDQRGRLNGGLPLVRLRSRMFGDFLVSMPYVNYGGPCADDHAIAHDLSQEAARLAAEWGVQHLEIRMDEPVDLGLQTRSAKLAMRLPLPATPDELWKRLGSKLRSQVKRAQQEDLTVRIGRDEELDGFYRVFSINMRDLGTPVYGRGFFQTILQELPESAWICCVYLKDEPVAAGFLVGFRETVEIPWASSQRRYNRLSPNMLLYWSVLKFACEQRFTVFDFGRSTPDSGPHRFKAQWGASPVPLSWHYWVPDGQGLPNLTPVNPRYQLAVRLWQHLPVSMTRIIGPSIVRNLP